MRPYEKFATQIVNGGVLSSILVFFLGYLSGTQLVHSFSVLHANGHFLPATQVEWKTLSVLPGKSCRSNKGLEFMIQSLLNFFSPMTFKLFTRLYLAVLRHVLELGYPHAVVPLGFP